MFKVLGNGLRFGGLGSNGLGCRRLGSNGLGFRVKWFGV